MSDFNDKLMASKAQKRLSRSATRLAGKIGLSASDSIAKEATGL